MKRLLPAAVKLITASAFGIFVYRAAMAYLHHRSLNVLLLTIAESVTVLLILIARPPEDVNIGFKTCLLTACGTYYFLAVNLGAGVQLVPPWLSEGFQVAGICWQLLSKLYLGNRFGLLPANRGIVDRGPYRIVRHPIYLGYLVNHIGFLLSAFSLPNLGIYCLLYLFQTGRLLEEEKLLSKDKLYREYCAAVRAHLIPGVF